MFADHVHEVLWSPQFLSATKAKYYTIVRSSSWGWVGHVWSREDQVLVLLEKRSPMISRVNNFDWEYKTGCSWQMSERGRILPASDHRTVPINTTIAEPSDTAQRSSSPKLNLWMTINKSFIMCVIDCHTSCYHDHGLWTGKLFLKPFFYVSNQWSDMDTSKIFANAIFESCRIGNNALANLRIFMVLVERSQRALRLFHGMLRAVVLVILVTSGMFDAHGEGFSFNPGIGSHRQYKANLSRQFR